VLVRDSCWLGSVVLFFIFSMFFLCTAVAWLYVQMVGLSYVLKRALFDGAV